MSNRTASALDRYTAAVEARDQHIRDNQSIFSVHEQIVNRIIDAENELRDGVAEEGAGISNGEFRVTVTPQSQEVCDLEALKANWPQAAAATVKTFQRPPRITIGRQPKTI